MKEVMVMLGQVKVVLVWVGLSRVQRWVLVLVQML
jgi:hypothetical protein